MNLLLSPLVLVLAVGLFLGILAIAMANRIKSSKSGKLLDGEQPAINRSLRMKMMFSIPIMLLVALVAFVAYIADQMFGVVAFTYAYLAFCLLAALVFGAVWRACFPKSAPAFALVVFGIIAANFILPPPSERLLRSAMLKAKPGTDASAIVDIVKQQYEGSPYEMPQIHEDKSGGFDRVHVSLLSQKQRNCTSVIFLIENGKVSRSIFSPD
jgi:Ca2+/Na+ antiporter